MLCNSALEYTETLRATAHVARNRPPPNFRIFKDLPQSSIDDVFHDTLEIFEHLSQQNRFKIVRMTGSLWENDVLKMLEPSYGTDLVSRSFSLAVERSRFIRYQGCFLKKYNLIFTSKHRWYFILSNRMKYSVVHRSSCIYFVTSHSQENTVVK